MLTATITSPWRWPSVKFQDGLVTPIRSDVYPGLPGQFSSLTSAGVADIKSYRGLPVHGRAALAARPARRDRRGMTAAEYSVIQNRHPRITLVTVLGEVVRTTTGKWITHPPSRRIATAELVHNNPIGPR